MIPETPDYKALDLLLRVYDEVIRQAGMLADSGDGDALRWYRLAADVAEMIGELT